MTRYYKSKYQKKEDKKPQKIDAVLNAKILGVVVMLGMVVIGGLYLGMTNNIAVKGYQLKDLERHVTALRQENEHLQIEATELESLQNVQGKLNALGLVPVEKIEYVSPTTGMVASK